MIEGKIADDGGHDSQDNDQHNYGNDNEFPAEEPSVDEPQKRTPPPAPPPPPKASFWFPEKPQGCFSPRAGDWVRSLAASSFPTRFLRAESHPMITPLARLAFLSGCVFFCSPPPPSPSLQCCQTGIRFICTSPTAYNGKKIPFRKGPDAPSLSLTPPRPALPFSSSSPFTLLFILASLFKRRARPVTFCCASSDSLDVL